MNILGNVRPQLPTHNEGYCSLAHFVFSSQRPLCFRHGSLPNAMNVVFRQTRAAVALASHSGHRWATEASRVCVQHIPGVCSPLQIIRSVVRTVAVEVVDVIVVWTLFLNKRLCNKAMNPLQFDAVILAQENLIVPVSRNKLPHSSVWALGGSRLAPYSAQA